MDDPFGDPYADMQKELKDHDAERDAERDADIKKFFTIHDHHTMKASTHKNNLKIGKKISRDESILINPKQVLLSKKHFMINN